MRCLPLLLVLLVAAACAGGSDSEQANRPAATQGNEPASVAVCPPAWRAGWQRLADRIRAPVFCPSWMPAPLTGEIDGEWNSTKEVESDGSYLIGFIFFESGAAEVHVNFRAYPGKTGIPTCNGKPCFNDPRAKKQIGAFEVQPYSVNRGADTWHLLYTWKADGSLYAVSQHVVPGLGLPYGDVAANLDRLVRGLVEIDPQQS